MDPDEALGKVLSRGTLVFLDVPANLEFGIDTYRFETGNQFKGIKMIPPGLHFVCYQAGHTRCGYFVYLESESVIINQWDESLEDFGDDLPDDDRERLVDAVKTFKLDPFLGAYPENMISEWVALSDHISVGGLKRCGIPALTKIMPGESEVENDDPSGKIQPYFPGVARVPHFPDLITSRRRIEGMTPTEISKYNLDASQRITELLEKEYSGDELCLLGDIQLSFILFLQLSSFPALEFWKTVINWVCTCDDLISQKPTFFEKFLNIMEGQMIFSERDIFEDPLLTDNFLRQSLACFYQSVKDLEENNAVHTSLSHRMESFRKFVKSRFDHDIQLASENEEDLPVVVVSDDIT